MARRLPSVPPVLPGFSHLHVLGTGGYADVFLYEQALPRRPVAVKVMLAELVDEDVRRAFRTEVNHMGRLSSHPGILTVYSASVASDGRPYLVMELASPVIGDRFRSEPLDLEMTLDIAVRIGSAIETAHRASVLHRDIKPANILTTMYGRPVLSDFGIAGGAQEPALTEGFSVPWAAPEVLRGDTGGTIATEVWSFGATLFSLLAGRSPAERPGSANDHASLTQRILDHDLLPSKAVHPKLRRILDRALAERPGDRYPAVLPMVEAIRDLQIELGFTPSPIEIEREPWVADDAPERPRAVDPDELRLRQRRVRRATRISGSQVDISASAEPRVPQRPRRLAVGLGIGGSLAVVAGLIVAGAVALSSLSEQIPVVSDITATAASGGVEFSWEDPGLVDTDSYSVRTSTGDAVIQGARTFRLTGEPGERLCITVAVNRDGTTGEGLESCAEALP